MLDIAWKFLRKVKQIKEVRMVLFDLESYKIFQGKFEELMDR